MSLMYSSALEITSIMTCGRNCASIFEMVSSLDEAPPRISAVVITCLTLQASPMMAAAAAFSPAVATITTRSAVLTSSTRSLVRPARSVSQPPKEKGSENGSPRRGAPENDDAVRKLARCHGDCASSLTMRSLWASSAITLTARGCEFGRSMRNFASAAELIRADSLCIRRSPWVSCLDIAQTQGYFIMCGVGYKALRFGKNCSEAIVHVRRKAHRALQHRRGGARRGAQGRDRGFDARGVQCRRPVLRHRRPVHPRPGLAVGRLYLGGRGRVPFPQRPVQYPHRRSGLV